MTSPPEPGRVVALGSARSAGVSTTAAALAFAWPTGRQVLLAEYDPAGGMLAARYGLAAEPGLVTLATAARRRGEAGLIEEHCQLLPGGVLVLAGPAPAAQAQAALAMLTGSLAALAGTGRDVLVDCGRLDPTSPVLGVFTGADLSLLVSRPQLVDLHALAGWLEGYRGQVGRLAVVLTGAGPYPPAEVADALGVEVLTALPTDPDGAAQLGAGARTRRGGVRSPLQRAAEALARDVVSRLPPGLVAPEGEGAAPPAATGAHQAGAPEPAAADLGAAPAGPARQELAGQVRGEH
ncbi:MAG: MinD/ParA family ATP-binding protein [Mycobacteriales bacterium]